ncbi:MAG: tRNA 4-thiouridine(8) synthase ThiI [bacterium]|nr:tRNA 4-thiouridine(8) synthase ThiI [bacterium]
MEKLIIIKYGELTTKKDNINFFLKTLKKNVIDILGDLPYECSYDASRMFIKTTEFEKVIEKLKQVFGIHKITIAYELSNDILEIKKGIISLLENKNFRTFKIAVKRSYKKYPGTSMELASSIGGYVLKNMAGKVVDVHNPDVLINVEIRKDFAYIYFEDILGIGGYPVGVQGKGLLMLSGGIDSPVSGYLAIKRGIKMECVYFEAPPHTSLEARNKVLDLARILAKYNDTYVRVHIINFTEIEEAIYKNIPNDYMITIMRRMMYRISAILANRNNCKVLVNGESIGQVASQTLNSMNCINEVIKIPVIRPVACFDKLEIIDLAKKIGTYDTSILPYEDCCTIFVPKHPVINPVLSKCYEYEELINYKDMIYRAIKNEDVVKVTVNDNENDEFLDVL